MKPSGYVLYQGPSQLDGSPIVAIATMRTENSKTGNMIQTWILRQDENPFANVKSGNDASVCGNCPRRPVTATNDVLKACYVKTAHAPLSVWRKWTRGGYPPAPDGFAAGRKVRLGSYGDPAAVPLSVWQRALQGASGHTGYTHQWRNFPQLSAYVMASVDFEYEIPRAESQGWRVFYAASPSFVAAQPKARFMACPASKEGGHRRTCESCGQCGGTASASPKHVIIIEH